MARASRRMAASPNLLPWFETARIAAERTQAAPAMARLLTMRPSVASRLLRQLVEALAEALQAHREADAFFRGLEDDEGCGLTRAQLLHQGLIHDHLGDAAIRQAAHEAGPPHVRLVDLEPQP